MKRGFRVFDSIFKKKGTFPTNAQAMAYILRRKNEIVVDFRRDEPGHVLEWLEVYTRTTETFTLVVDGEETGIYLRKES